jgi:hypothetical protein
MQGYDASRFDPPAPLALVTVKSEPLGIVIPPRRQSRLSCCFSASPFAGNSC